LYPGRAESEFSRFVLENLARIQRRLGGECYEQVKRSFQAALNEFFTSQRIDGFNQGIETLLTHYYDPMYRYQLANKSAPIIFEGPENEYLEWVRGYLVS
jgi:tRNA 2-selenouridine synthase